MATRSAKIQAVRIDRERRTMERIGERTMRRVAAGIRDAVFSAYNGNGDLGTLIRQASEAGAVALWSGMTAAALLARQRAMLTFERRLRKQRLARLALYGGPVCGWKFAAIQRAWSYEKAVDYLAQRQKLTPIQVEDFAAKFGNESVRVMRGAAKSVEKRVQTAVGEIAQQGMHVKDGMAHLQRGLSNAGVGQQNPWLLETLVRTQVNMAYSAGQWMANEDPAVASILWGYEYSATGDDRTRPNHAALDGTRLSKDSPMWNDIAPPNGFNCRCKLIEIFNDEPARAKTKIGKGGPETVQPDKGFAFNPVSIVGSGHANLPPIKP